MNLEQAIHHLEEELKNKQDWSCVACKEEHEKLLEWLKELQAIKDTDSNEALEKLDSMYHLCTPQHYYYKLDNCYDTIKNYILKAQDKEKVLKIINEKNVDILAIKESKTLEEYNRNAWEIEHYGRYKGYKLQLTQEEFNTLKEYFR